MEVPGAPGFDPDEVLGSGRLSAAPAAMVLNYSRASALLRRANPIIWSAITVYLARHMLNETLLIDKG